MLTGAAYLLFFMIFPVGWVILQGMLRLVASVAVVEILIVSRLVYISVKHAKQN